MNINVTIDTGVPEVDDYLARQLRGVVERAVNPVVLAPAQPVELPRFHREQEYTRDQARIRELLDEAVRMRATVDITYEDATGTFTRRDFSPSRVVNASIHRGAPAFTVGYCQAREEPRTFRLDRIKALEVR